MDDLIVKINAMLARSGNEGLVRSGADIVEAALRAPEVISGVDLRLNDSDGVKAPVELGDEQRFVFERMENGNDIMFITGRAGTGKSFLLKYFKENTQKKCAVVAPTGMAAVNVGGQTIHSFFRLDLGVQYPQNINEIEYTWLRGKLRCIDVLVIDEVSMVRADVMDMIDRKMRLANDNTLPFGGKQVIMFGDPYQLPPVVDDNIERELPRFFDDNYGSAFFFSAPVIRERPLKVCELTEMFRQRDGTEFVGILNKVRDGTVRDSDIDILNERCYGKPADGRRYTTLVPTNDAAAKINSEELRKIPSREFVYEAVIDDRDKKIRALDFQAERYLRLKVGALIVMLENGAAWVNGTLGVVSYLDDNFIRVAIRGVEHTVNKRVWEKKEYRYDARAKTLSQTTVATFTQYPVKLAWALTIHKAQGQTYDAVAIDMGRGAFECGQAYVALSRCRGMDSLYLLRKIQPTDIKVNQNVAEFMRFVGTDKNGGIQAAPSGPVMLTEADNKFPCRQLTNNGGGKVGGIHSGGEQELLSMYRQLDDHGKLKLIEFLRSGKNV